MKSRTTENNKHWHHTEDRECPLCDELTVFVVDHRENSEDCYECTECHTKFVDESGILMTYKLFNDENR